MACESLPFENICAMDQVAMASRATLPLRAKSTQTEAAEAPAKASDQAGKSDAPAETADADSASFLSAPRLLAASSQPSKIA